MKEEWIWLKVNCMSFWMAEDYEGGGMVRDELGMPMLMTLKLIPQAKGEA